MKEFFRMNHQSIKQHVVVVYQQKKIQEFSSILDAIHFMNQKLQNFRLVGVELYTVFAPTIKEMGAILLSRVDKITFLQSSKDCEDIWDCFKVHKTKRVLYDPAGDT